MGKLDGEGEGVGREREIEGERVAEEAMRLLNEISEWKGL